MRKAFLVLLAFMLIFAGCEDPLSRVTSKEDSVENEDPEPEDGVLSIIFGNGAGESPVALTGLGFNLTSADDPVTTFTIAGNKKGFTIDQVKNNYGYALAYFKVDFGDKKFGDYSKIKFNFQTAGDGDIDYKEIYVYSRTSVPPNWIGLNNDSFASTAKIADLTKNDAYTLDIPVTAPGVSLSVVYFIIGLNNQYGKYTVSNVSFELKS
jgi:hypothetical protein